MTQKSTSLTLLFTTVFLLLYTLWTLVISIRELTLPVEHHSEFDAMHTFFQGVILLVICLLAIVLLISCRFIFKLKKWAYILAILITILMIPLTDLVTTPDVIFNLMEGAPLAVVKEIIPSILILLLIFRFREFWPAKSENTGV